MRSYKALTKKSFTAGRYSIVPIRDEDKYPIMQWRNEQMYHLRQAEPITQEKQDWYFKNVVAKLFDQERPSQILFSFLKEDVCIGYGGLVHINWLDKHAEISFIMNTELEQSSFENNWRYYLGMIQQVAFKELSFHKLFTYAFDLRPYLYKIFEKLNFVQEARLKEHVLYQGRFIDVVIHGKINE